MVVADAALEPSAAASIPVHFNGLNLFLRQGVVVVLGGVEEGKEGGRGREREEEGGRGKKSEGGGSWEKRCIGRRRFAGCAAKGKKERKKERKTDREEDSVSNGKYVLHTMMKIWNRVLLQNNAAY